MADPSWYKYPSTQINFNQNKVEPLKVTPPKKNNYVKNGVTSLLCLKFQICAALVFAINRIYLFRCNKVIIILSYIYTLVFAVCVLGMMISSKTLSASHAVFTYSLCFEYIAIVLVALFTSHNKMLNFFRDLNKFDETININKDLKKIDSGYFCVYWILGCLVYSFIEYAMIYFYLTIFIDDSVYFVYIMMLAHDCEQIMYFVLLRNIYWRLRIVKAHVLKVLAAKENHFKKPNKVEELSNNARLDINSLHRVYDLLHKCADQLNSIMSVPMVVILLASGLSTTMLLKMMVKTIQTVSLRNSFGQSVIIYLFSRSIKYSGLVVVPCYYSGITTTQVSIIRTALHNAIYSSPMEKIERRKAKAFFQLTRENEFTYALGGVIRLNMALPLSYLSLCTTYLVISIQFSKFFD